MASRFARHWFLPALFAVCAAVPVVGAGAASAATATAAQPSHWGPGDHDGYGNGHGGYHRYRHHYHPNCNNDPESPYAMGPQCPRSHNTPHPPWWD
jgi:hypothetical protein